MHRFIRMALAAVAVLAIIPLSAAPASAASGPCPVAVSSPSVASTAVKLCKSGLTATKSVDNRIPTQGSEITFTLTVTNSGQVPELGVRALDKLPPELTFIGASGDGHYFASTGLWIIGNLLPGSGVRQPDKATLHITVLVNGPDQQTNCVTATGEPVFGKAEIREGGQVPEVKVTDTSNTACAQEVPTPATPAPGKSATPTPGSSTTTTTTAVVTPGFPATGAEPDGA